MGGSVCVYLVAPVGVRSEVGRAVLLLYRHQVVSWAGDGVSEVEKLEMKVSHVNQCLCTSWHTVVYAVTTIISAFMLEMPMETH